MRLLFLALLVSTSVALAVPPPPNFIYKGTKKTYDFDKGTTVTKTLYLVMGAHQTTTNFDYETGTEVTYGGAGIHKQYTQGGAVTFYQADGLHGKIPYALFISGDSQTTSNFFKAESFVLSGPVSNAKYALPVGLTGFDQSSGSDRANTGNGSRIAYALTLDRVLTDSSNAAQETQAKAVERVTVALSLKGYKP